MNDVSQVPEPFPETQADRRVADTSPYRTDPALCPQRRHVTLGGPLVRHVSDSLPRGVD